MSFGAARFSGLTVIDWKSSLGWDGQVGQLDLQLVQDAGDNPVPVPLGWPCHFQFGGFTFGGLLQKFGVTGSVNGRPLYEAVLVDPREILDGTQVITGGYNGAVNVPNLLNAYGWKESFGFGGSLWNSAGMPFWRIREAIEEMVNVFGGTPYGGPLNFRGVSYTLDLSELPVPPSYYRIPGNSISLLELITQVCEDSGCNFFIDLIGLKIRVRVVSRFAQPPLGTISRLVANASFSGLCPRVESGVEVRNEITSAFLVGGEQNTLHLTTGIVSFWGYDLFGAPIVGIPAPHPGIDGLHDYMSLNATGIADIIGAISYDCNTVELRCAKKSYYMWSAYIKKYKPNVLPLIHCLVGKDIGNPSAKVDIINDSASAVTAASNVDIWTRSQRLYNFIKGYADEFYGKQFLVQLPFVLTKVEQETLQVVHSNEIADAGYLAQGAAALGLSAQNQDVFLNPDERILPLVQWSTSLGAELSQVNWADTVVETNRSVYSRVNVTPKMIFLSDNTPCAHIRLSSVLFEQAADQFGGKPFIDGLLNAASGSTTNVDKQGAAGTIGFMALWPAARYPEIAAIPLKSNILTYGPWFAVGAPGKVRFEQDASLVPWEYGGYTTMNNAAAARVVSAVTNMQLSEYGTIEAAGMPQYSLGDVLQTGGPNVTNVSVTFGTQGVTTNYRFQTYTPRFGLFSRQNAERMKRMSLAAVELRRSARKALNKAISAMMTLDAANRGFLANAPKYVKKESPHDVILGKSWLSDNAQTVRAGASSETYESALALVHADNPSEYKNVAIMSLNGLIRPFTTNPNFVQGSLLPKFGYPARTGSSGLGSGNPCLGSDSLNPFQGSTHDIEVLAYGPSYNGAHAYRRGASSGDTRAMSLRGPLVVTGWGWGTDGQQFPNATGDGPNGTGSKATWLTDTLLRSDKWMSGPVDLLWDPWRKVWTSHDIMWGVVADGNVITARSGSNVGSGVVNVGGSTGWALTAYNVFAGSVPSGTTVMLGYCLNSNDWRVIAADCSAFGGGTLTGGGGGGTPTGGGGGSSGGGGTPPGSGGGGGGGGFSPP